MGRFGWVWVATLAAGLSALPASAHASERIDKTPACSNWYEANRATDLYYGRVGVERFLGQRGDRILNGSREFMGADAAEYYPRGYAWFSYPACNPRAELTIIYQDGEWAFAEMTIMADGFSE